MTAIAMGLTRCLRCSPLAVLVDESHRALLERHHHKCSVKPSPEACKALRALYTSVMSSSHFTSVSRTIPRPPTHEQVEGQKELTGLPATSAAACPHEFEAAGAGPLAVPATGAAAGCAATTEPAPGSLCPRSSLPASTTSRTSTWVA